MGSGTGRPTHRHRRVSQPRSQGSAHREKQPASAAGVVGQASLSVGYAACADKSNELEALPRLLASLQLKGAVVSIDAMAGHP